MTQFQLNTLSDYSDQSLIDELIRVSKLVDGKLSRTAFNKHSKVHPSTLEKRFGSWEKALEKAGLSDRFDDSNQKIPREKMIEELKRVASKIKTRKVKKSDFDTHGKYNYTVILREFGSWKKALEAADLEISNLGRRYTDEECFENLLAVWTHYGRQPYYAEMKKAPSTVGPKAYILRWGNWRKALHAFVEKVNQDIEESNTIEKSPQDTITEKKKTTVPDSEKRDIKLGLRYEILKRDRFKCVICGASPSTKIDCELHVDHIIPFSKGGKTVRENLRSLCKDCNLGKGDKIEDIETS